MIEIEFTQRDEDGKEETFSNDARDTYRWEVTDKDKRPFLSVFAEGTPRIVDLYRLAHITARRLGLVTCDLDEYATKYVVEVEFSEKPEEPDPTSAAASPDE